MTQADEIFIEDSPIPPSERFDINNKGGAMFLNSTPDF